MPTPTSGIRVPSPFKTDMDDARFKDAKELLSYDI